MMKLILLRHGESTWNLENRFTGWTDVELTDTGLREAREAGERIKEAGLAPRMAYASYLKRAINTLDIVLDVMNRDWIPVEKHWRLNEKHYGALQGLNKAETASRYGEAQVRLWRRDYNTAPPALTEDDPRNPRFETRYADVPSAELPRTESLRDTVERILPYWNGVILPSLDRRGEILVVAHGNSLRAIVKQLKKISDDAIAELNLPTGVPYVFEFDSRKHPSADYFLGDPEEIRRKAQAVAEQGKAR